MADNEAETQAARPINRKLLLFVALAAVVAVVAGFLLFGGGDSPAPAPAAHAQQQPVGLSKAELAALPVSDTHATIKGAPKDKNPRAKTSGVVVHPTTTAAVYAAPDGKPIAKLKPKQFGDTWLPVVDSRPGWVQVLLPSKPNDSAGWMRTGDLRVAKTGYLIKVDLADMRMDLWHKGRKAGSWTVGIGKPDTPTPTGRTFLLGSITDEKQQFSEVILPLGSHSATLDSFGGGPGTVAIHTWPTTDVFGVASSHGCIRVPQDALERLTKVPLGTLVVVS